jgi:hypothetical protein
MTWRRREKIEIRVSKLLMLMAMNDASATAIRHELARQTREQLRGTWLENSRITVVYGFAEHPMPTVTVWTPIPDSQDLTFTWVD